MISHRYDVLADVFERLDVLAQSRLVLERRLDARLVRADLALAVGGALAQLESGRVQYRPVTNPAAFGELEHVRAPHVQSASFSVRPSVWPQSAPATSRGHDAANARRGGRIQRCFHAAIVSK